LEAEKNIELEKIFVENFFKEIPKNNNSSIESNRPENYEKIFYGLREEVPPGKTKGEINSVIYHAKKEGKENSENSSVQPLKKVQSESTYPSNPKTISYVPFFAMIVASISLFAFICYLF
jgi:hypothetical protein